MRSVQMGYIDGPKLGGCMRFVNKRQAARAYARAL